MNGNSAQASARAAINVTHIAEHLHSRLFEGLSKSERESILKAGLRRRCFAHSVVVHQEDPAGRLFMLTTGRGMYFYITEKGRKIILHWLTPGDIFGGAALLSTPFHYLVSVEVLRDSWLLVWDHATIRSLAARYPRLMENTLAIALKDYLAWYVAAHAALTCDSARERLARVLIGLCQGTSHITPDGIALDVTNEELANASNITPFTASRLLNEWQRSGALSKSRGRVLIRAPERLAFP